MKKNLDSHKDIPIIVVCNKVDDPDDDELMSLVKESRLEVESVFAVDDREKALQAIIDGEMEHQPHMSPAFLPVSFENAFLYRTVSSLPMGDIKRLGKVYIDKIGHEEVSELLAKWSLDISFISWLHPGSHAVFHIIYFFIRQILSASSDGQIPMEETLR